MATVYKSLSKSTAKKPDEEAKGTSSAPRKNRQRVLILSSRGVTFRHRHLLADLHSLLPHSRKDAKLDTKTHLAQLNELADLYNCNNILFFEARKGKDLYAWLAKPPNGPTLRCHLQNLHTMEELHFTGNCLRGSRPVLSFSAEFEAAPHLRLIRELLTQVFGVPKTARRIKPFVDHVLGFTVADGKIWVRCYQIAETERGKGKENNVPQVVLDARIGTGMKENGAEAEAEKKKGKEGETAVSLVEIGPRFVLTPIVVLEGSFGGPVIYENLEFVSPNQIRADLRLRKAGKYNRRADAGIDRKIKRGELGLRTEGGRRKEPDELDEKVLFA